jgi:hypothetical protein
MDRRPADRSLSPICSSLNFDYGQPVRESGQSSPVEDTLLLLQRHVPLHVRRRGIEMRLVVGGGGYRVECRFSSPEGGGARKSVVDRALISTLEFAGRGWQARRCWQTLCQSNHSVGFSGAFDRRTDCSWLPTTAAYRPSALDTPRRPSSELASAKGTNRVRRSRVRLALTTPADLTCPGSWSQSHRRRGARVADRRSCPRCS